MRTALIFALVLSASPAFAFTDEQIAATDARYAATCEKFSTKEAADQCFDDWRKFLSEAQRQEAETAKRNLDNLDQQIAAARHRETVEAIDALRNSNNSNQSYSCSYVGNGQSICNPQ